MADKKQKKQAFKTAKKLQKKNPKIFIAVILILLIICSVREILYFSGALNGILNKNYNKGNQTPTTIFN